MPFTSILRKAPVIFDVLRNDGLSEVFYFFQKHAGAGDGVSNDEFTDKDEFIKKYSNPKFYNHKLTHEETKKMVGFIGVFPSPLCRSVSPILNAGYIVMDPQLKGSWSQIFSFFIVQARRLGYLGIAGRASVLNPPAFQGLKKIGGTVPGCIPSSIYVDKIGWADDLIVHFPFMDITRRLAEDDRPAPILPAPCLKPAADSLTADWLDDVCDDVKLFDGSVATIALANESDRLSVEHMILDAAAIGDGFGFDDLNPDGTFSRTLLHSSATLVAKDATGQAIGGIICGPTKLCRSPNNITLGIYMVVHGNRRRVGIATRLMDSLIKLAEANGYDGLIADPYIYTTALIRLSHKFGMVVIGSVPFSGWLLNHGYTDTLVMHRRFMPTVMRDFMSSKI